jgi:glycosyltransferase involved in cell wall biosynthesis
MIPSCWRRAQATAEATGGRERLQRMVETVRARPAAAPPGAPASPAPRAGTFRTVAVLPDKERFAPSASGAVALMLRDLAREGTAHAPLAIFGQDPHEPPFAGCDFHAIRRNRLAALLLGRRAAYARALRDALRAHAPDIVQVHNRPALARDLAASLAPVPVILALHNHADTMPAGRSAPERRLLAQHLAAIVCISDHVRERFLHGVPPELATRVVTIRRGLSPAALPAPAPPAARRREILFVGRLNAEKGADAFVAAAARALPALPGWSARMIGAAWYGTASKETPFVAALRPAAAAAGVALAGFLPNDATLAAMAEAAIVVLPSRWAEPFARVALEALACGAVLVASPRGGIPEAAGDAALYADPDDADALGEAIRRAATDDALRARLHAAGLARAAGLTIGDTARAYAALRERILGR